MLRRPLPTPYLSLSQHLEDRLAAMVEPQLAAALASRQGGAAADAAALLDAAGRAAALPRLFAGARAPYLAAAWDDHDAGAPGGFVAWLPAYYRRVADAATADARWAAAALPGRAPALVAALVATNARSVDRQFRARLAASLAPRESRGGGGAARPGRQPPIHGSLPLLPSVGARALDPLRAVASASREHASALARLLDGAPPADAAAALVAGLAPVEGELAHYGELETAALAADLGAHRPPVPGAPPAAAASYLRSLGAALEAAASGAIARCGELTGGSGVPALLAAADAAAAGAAGAATAAQRAAPPVPSSTGGSAAAVELLAVAVAAADAAAAADRAGAALRAAVAALVPPLLAAAGAPPAPLSTGYDVHAARVRASPALAADLAAAAASRTALPTAAPAFADLVAAARGVVRSALLADVLTALDRAPDSPAWAAGGGAGVAGVPAFSAYPQAWATAAGEALLALPASLEAALDVAGGGDGAAWLDELTATSAAAATSSLSRIRTLTPAGSAQLAADVVYLAGALRTLGAAVPPPLAAWGAAAGWGDADFAAAAADALEGGDVDPGAIAAVQAVAVARGLAV